MAKLSEAIKLDEIESPSGDLMRNYGVIHNHMSSSLLSCNRNRRSLALDLKKAGGYSESEAGKLASSGVLAARRAA